MSELRVKPYAVADKAQWDEAVDKSRQGTFLFCRDFMDYHADRFRDASLMVENATGHVVAVLPACVSPLDEKCIESHAGLTYGGLLLPVSTGTLQAEQAFSVCLAHYREMGYATLTYKPVPHIYHTYPAEEELYWLFRAGAKLTGRAISSVIDLRYPAKMQTLRRRCAKKALRRADFSISDSSDFLPAYWEILTEILNERHGAQPVHSLAEIELLMSRFPQEIRLFTAQISGRVVAGCLLFLTKRVVHVQYIAVSDEGCRLGALDALFDSLIHDYAKDAAQRPWFDFGTSTERGGAWLNEGLIFQKEGFGGRAVCYDKYTLFLSNTSDI